SETGRAVHFSGAATDPEEGKLDCSHFTWTVILHHKDHTHPFKGPLQGICSGVFVTVNHGEDPSTVYFEVHLDVADSGVPLGPAWVLVGSDVAIVRNPQGGAADDGAHH